jgi:hypothetical protein
MTTHAKIRRNVGELSATARKTGSPAVRRNRIAERDTARRDWQMQLEEGETLQDALRPEFFGQKADALSRGDRIAVLGSDLGFWAELLVIELAERILDVPDFDTSKIQVEQIGPDNYRLRHGNRVVSGGFKTRAAAEERLDEIRAGRKAARPGE